MPIPLKALAMVVVVGGIALQSFAQDEQNSETRSGRTMKPVITGRQYAVTAMKHQASEAAVRILEKGGNAFDAAVAGQAVLALVDPANNGYGSDAVVLVYDAAARKVWSSTQRGPRRGWRRSSGISSTTAGSSRTATASFQPPFRASWTPGTRCSIAGAR
jgi:hypothetical protein